MKKRAFISVGLLILVAALLIFQMFTHLMPFKALILVLLPILLIIIVLIIKKDPIDDKTMIRFMKDYQKQLNGRHRKTIPE